MQTKNSWIHTRFKLFVVLCVALLGQGLFTGPALAGNASDRDMSYSVITRGVGKLDMFIVRDCDIWMKSWTGSVWTSWRNLGRPADGSCLFTVSAVAAGNNRWDIFSTVGSGGGFMVWHKAFDGLEHGWQSRGSANGSGYGVQAVSTGNGRIDLFTRANCSTVGCGIVQWKVRSATGVWSPCATCDWSVLDNTANDFSLSALAHSGNRIDLFRGPDSDTRILRKYFNGTSWGPVNPFTKLSLNQWQNMNGEALQTPYAVSWGTNRIDVFVRGMDNNVYINSTDNAGTNWNGWAPLGRGGSDPITSAVSAVAWGANRLDVFMAEGATAYHKVWDGANWWPNQTGGWENIGLMSINLFHNPPLPVSWGSSRIDLFKYENGVSKRLYHKWTNGGGWGPSQTEWENLGPD